MSYSTVTSKGQVTIPKAVRDRMGIDEGSRLVFVDDGDRILVYKVDSDLESLYGAVKHEGLPIDFGKLKEEMAEDIARQAVEKLAPSRGKEGDAEAAKVATAGDVAEKANDKRSIDSIPTARTTRGKAAKPAAAGKSRKKNA